MKIKKAKHDMTTVFHAWSYGSFIEIRATSGERNFIEQTFKQQTCPNFLGGSFSSRGNVRSPLQFWRESKSQHLKIWFFLKSRPISIPASVASVLWDRQTKPVEFFQHWSQQAKVDLTTLVQVLEEKYGVFCKLEFEVNITQNLS